MDIQFLLQVLSNKITTLNTARGQVFASGNIDQVAAIDKDLLDTQNTINQLNMLAVVEQAAKTANVTPAELVASGVDAVQNAPTTVIPDSPTGVLTYYNLSSYASDPLYLQKITDILSVMPTLDTASDVDNYIGSEAIGSPLTGAMLMSAAQQYTIDVRLLAAILELESNFGTAGMAISTLNPGNVGNTGSGTRTYNTWQDGVGAVAEWLSNHLVTSITATAPTASVIVDTSQTTATTPAYIPVVPMNPLAFTQSTIVASPPVVTPISAPDANVPVVAPAATPDPVPPVVAPAPTTTPPIISDPAKDASSTPTSTPPVVITPDPVSTSTPASSTPIIVPKDSDASSTVDSDNGSSTPSTTSSSTPLSVNTRKKRRMIV